MKPTIILLCFLLMSAGAIAQPAFRTIDSININNINASVLVHGDMWWNGDSTNVSPHCRLIEDTTYSIGFVSSVWLSAYDSSGNLYTTAQTYRQSGLDYWPGPLDASGSLTISNSTQWSRIWKISRSDINYFRSSSVHTLSNTPGAVLSWPGRGNSYATGAGGSSITVPADRDMAPFKDLNGNGIYEPLLGEYPDVKGDMALWWIFSDNGPTHNASNGRPLKVEIHALMFGYKRGTVIDNAIFYNFSVFNRSSIDYNRFRLAQWHDVDLGYYLDDHIGFDSFRRLAICYNGRYEAGYPHAAHELSPVTAITMIRSPGDSSGVLARAGSFTYYNNDFSYKGFPTIDTEYNNLMRSTTTRGGHFRHNFTDHPCNLQDTGSYVDYVFTGDPGDTNSWSECGCNNLAGDRRYILSSRDYTLKHGQSLDFTFALLATHPKPDDRCPNTNFSDIRNLSDTAWAVYEHPLWETGVEEPAAPQPHATLYPNPAHNTLTLELGQPHIGEVCIRDIPGKAVRTLLINTPKTTIDISDLAPGTYVLTTNLKEQPSILFTKQ